MAAGAKSSIQPNAIRSVAPKMIWQDVGEYLGTVQGETSKHPMHVMPACTFTRPYEFSTRHCEEANSAG